MAVTSEGRGAGGTAGAGEERRIVVGYDGSAVGLAAVAYAAEQVGAGGQLIVAHAYGAPPEWEGTPYYQSSLDRNQAHAREAIAAIPEDILRGAKVETELVQGRPAAALLALAESRGAEEIVVGSRGFGPIRGTLGSVSHGLLHEANVPVVVVPARMLGSAAGEREASRIVVGYDGSPTASDALSHAAYRAGADGELVVVYAFRPPLEYVGTPFEKQAMDDFHARGRALLAQVTDEMVSGLACERVVLEGPAAEALVDVAQSRRASEIVVGSRGLGGLRAALGSVSHALLHDADRPVVVVPHTLAPEEQEALIRDRRATRFRRGLLRL